MCRIGAGVGDYDLVCAFAEDAGRKAVGLVFDQVAVDASSAWNFKHICVCRCINSAASWTYSLVSILMIFLLVISVAFGIQFGFYDHFRFALADSGAARQLLGRTKAA